MIEKVENYLDAFDLGASTAEKDTLLESAKIETQEFYDLYLHDRIDIVRGMKGSGKTALYRLFFFLTNHLIEKKNLYCIFGIEATGDPIFKLFQKEFESYSEIEFENFWGIYFIVLVYKLIFNAEKLQSQISGEDVNKIDEILSRMGLKIHKDEFIFKDIQCSILDYMKRAKIKFGVEAKIDPVTSLPTFKPAIEIEPNTIDEVSKRPIYLIDFKNLVVSIIEKYKIKIWIMLDRLDEVFPHRSMIEKNGLKGLLRAAYNFSDPSLRIKVFLRDDIIEYLAADGFTALTHITDRCSATMSWSKDDILYLIIKRIAANPYLRYEYGIDPDRINKDKTYRSELFYKIFPQRIGKTPTFDWLFGCCSDGNDIVTPRDIIDFFRFAKAFQFKKFKLSGQQQEFLIEEDIFKRSLEALSKHKKTLFLFAEFPHLKEYLLRFEGGCSEHNAESLQRILGGDWIKLVEELKSIGFLKHIPKSGVYKIPIIWRQGLSIKRRKAFKGK